MSSPKDSRPSASNYRKPPVEYQYKKGQSGHPEGRPKKKQPQLGGLGGGIADRLSAMALDEATRPVTVREGDKVSEIPAMQALLRTMFRAAATGDAKAGRQILELIARAESSRTAGALEILKYATHYKEKNLPVFVKHEREGLDPPEIYPHPDDIFIDESTGETKIDGPVTKEQAGARKAARAQALGSMRRYFEVEEALEKDPTNRELRREFKDLKKFYDFLKEDAERNIRHEALRVARRTLEPKAVEPRGDTSEEA